MERGREELGYNSLAPHAMSENGPMLPNELDIFEIPASLHAILDSQMSPACEKGTGKRRSFALAIRYAALQGAWAVPQIPRPQCLRTWRPSWLDFLILHMAINGQMLVDRSP
jgi:hypothetical protein